MFESGRLDLPDVAGVLIDAVASLSAARSNEEIRERVAHAARALVGSDGATLVVADGDQCWYVDEDAISTLWKGSRFPMSACISGWAMLHSEQVSIPDIYVDDRIPHEAYRPTFVKSLTMTPITSGEVGAVGAIGTYWGTLHETTPMEHALLAALADATAVVMDNVRLYSLLEDSASQLRLQLGELDHRLLYDPLTGLANRVLFTDRLASALATLSRHGGQVLLLLVDLDRFTLLNDSVGHAAGDRLLREMANRICSVVRPTDTCARLSGDEFAVLLSGPEGTDDFSALEACVARVREAISQPISTGRDDKDDVVVTASVGAAHTNDGSVSAADLWRFADVALFTARAEGGNRSRFFDDGLHDLLRHRFETESSLRLAAARGELRLHYQPIVDLDTGQVTAVEALVRWQHGERLLPPAEFIATAEETGMISQIGEWVLDNACAEVATWNQAHPTQRLGLHVNVSPRQLGEASLVDAVRHVLARHLTRADELSLEITETALMADPQLAVKQTRRLTDLGVRIALDDFGTGYSSLAYLTQFPIHCLKVDRSFVAGLDDPHHRAVTRSVISLATELGIPTVSEGVERPDQIATLRALGSTHAQGFALARPGPDLAAVVAQASRAVLEPS